ncbi:MAG: PEP-utilizing enzyme [Acidimicrobiales bacterium]
MNLAFDTAFDPDFPVYTRANAGEVLPDAIGPLGWSLVGPGLEEGFRIALCDNLGALPRSRYRDFQLVGRFAGYFHLNLSALRLAAERLPGTSATAVDRQYLGDAGLHGLSPYRPVSSDLSWKAKATFASARTLATLGRRIRNERAEIDRARHETTTMINAGATSAELAEQLGALMKLHARAFGSHVTARALTSSALELATGALKRNGVGSDGALRQIAEIPDLESAKPSRELLALAQSVSRDRDLSTLIKGGATRAQLAEARPAGAELVGRIDRFISAFGHRGLNEYDPTAPAWEQRPDDVVTMLASLLSGSLASSGGGPVPAPAVGPRALPLTNVLLKNARRALRRGESTKDNVIRVTHEMRRLLGAMAPLVADRIEAEHLGMVSFIEFKGIIGGETVPTIELEQRRRDMEAVASLRLAEWSDGGLRLVPEGAGARSPSGTSLEPIELAGIPGSAGVARGRARVMVDPYSYFEEGDILVAQVTDTAWTPLFTVAGAVVTDVGGILSHATIVARELGIPAVVNTKVATAVILDEDVIEVDGGRGTVTLLARTPRSEPTTRTEPTF